MFGGAAFLARRMLHAMVVVVGITFVVAAMIKLVPGDPVDIMAAGNPGMSETDKDHLREQLDRIEKVPGLAGLRRRHDRQRDVIELDVGEADEVSTLELLRGLDVERDRQDRIRPEIAETGDGGIASRLKVIR